MKGDYIELERLLAERTDAQKAEKAAIISTASCFAPRQPDDIKVLSKIARKHSCLHLVNNAYGIQSPLVMRELNQSEDVTLAISSCDKNYLVPVGGALIYSRHKDVIKRIGDAWPGRASLGSVLDLFITLL